MNYETPQTNIIGDNKIERADLLELAHPPEVGHTQVVLVVNPSDRNNRQKDPLTDESYGALDDGAAEKTTEFAAEYLGKILEQIPEDERRDVRVMVFASLSELIEPDKPLGVGHHKRALEGAEASLKGVRNTFEQYGLPKENILNTTDQNKIYTPKGLVDMTMLTDSPEYVDFLIAEAKKRNEENWGQAFWRMYEDDEFHDKRVELGAEGPAEIANALNWNLSLIARSMNYVHDQNPNSRLIILATGMYDNISPYLQRVVGDNWRPIEKGAGVAIDYDPKTDKMTANIKGLEHEYNPWLPDPSVDN